MKFCVVIPVYRHAETLKAKFAELLDLGETLILVDDGNLASDAALLGELAEHPLVELLRFDTNRGKGAAVTAGLQHALKAGFSHAVQIDADGQHQVGDIPRFIEAARQHPKKLILGTPVFDETAPLARVYGRKLSTWMVQLETRSRQVRDALFGFRVYPLAVTGRALDACRFDQGMGFDTQIVVRLLWDDVKVENIPSSVHYPKNGFSNFRYLADNLKLIRMHLRLLFESPGSGKHWHWSTKREHGSILAFRLLLVLYRLGGRPLLSALMYPVVAYYYLKDGRARKASRDYLDHVLGEGKGSSFRHFRSFGQKIISSLQGWLGEIDPADICWENTEILTPLLQENRGALVLSAHFGCLEVSRSIHFKKPGLRITPMMYLKNSQVFRSFLREINPEAESEIVYLDSIHPGVAIDLKQRVDSGEFVAILADRTAAEARERTIEVEFFGECAMLPEGPFVLAELLDCPVFLFFSYYDESISRYRARWETFEIPRSKQRSERAAVLGKTAQRFAGRLEAYCRDAPYQWFNFYDFWRG